MAKQASDIGERIRNTDARFRVMDDMGVDMQLISPGAAADLLHLPLEIAVKATPLSMTASLNMSAGIPTGWWRSAACRCRTATRRPRSLSAA